MTPSAARAIAGSAFAETSRQPAFALVILFTLLSYALSPSIAMFALGEDLALLKDFGLSTALVAGLLVVSLGASSVVGRDLELGTAGVLLSRPVSRHAFLLGKVLGVCAAATMAFSIFTVALFLAAREGPAIESHGRTRWPAAAVELAAILLAAVIAGIYSRRSARPFRPAVIKMSCVTLLGAFLAVSILDPDPRHPSGFDSNLLKGALLALLAVYVLASVASLLAVLLGRGAFLGTILVFLAGLVLGEERPVAFGLVPDLQLFWVGEVFYARNLEVPWSYVAGAGAYAAACSTACVAAAAFFLERRELP
ncbi:MAG TPA: hypothetical protein VMT52_00500 [Planctomycetota bacterium]|nr:hypothetical protein [Planctomycetota bacterium]